MQAYVDVLGTELTVELLLAFGGAALYIGNEAWLNGQLAQLVGLRHAMALSDKAHLTQKILHSHRVAMRKRPKKENISSNSQ